MAVLVYNRCGMKKIFLFYVILQTVLLAAQENDRNYVWPLDVYNGISSTFQEFRSNHFHAGIDLRTYQETGYPVLAITDGVIDRIIMSRTGMGLVVYLKHKDGNYSIYGHLERFCESIESQVVREQSRSGEKYFGAYTLPSPLAVKRGEIIAFSGESGFGFPHLHLEIRDKLDGALNPLSWIGNLPPDEYAPVLKGIVLRSRGSFLLNDDLGEFYIKLRKKGSLYTLDEPLSVTGPFDLGVQTYDLMGSLHRVAPFALEAYLDGQLYYQVAFERLIRDDNNQLGMLYDMSYSTSGAYFYKLFFQSGFALEKQHSPFAENIQRLSPGTHEIRIIVKDRQQNQSLAVIPLQVVPPAPRTAPEKEPDLKAGRRQVLFNTAFSTYLNRDDVVIKIRGFDLPAAWISLKVQQGDREQVVAASPYGGGVFFCFKPLNNEMRLQLRFILSDGQQPVEELQKNIQLLVLKSQTAQQFNYGDFSADFAAKSVLEPTVLLLEREAIGSDYPILAGPVSVYPDHFAFLDTVFFKFKIPQGQDKPEQLGIFKYEPLGRNWRYIRTQKMPEAGYLGTRVLNGGIFALLRDIFPPQISFRGRRSLRSKKGNTLVVHLRDRGMGIDDRTVAVWINGQKADSEYDPDWGHILISASAGLRKGKNELLVQATDLAGNGSEKVFHFHSK
jgi:hypothetical protein